MKKLQILFLGAGKMGGIIAKNIYKNFGTHYDIIVLKPSKRNKIKGLKYISRYDQFKKDYKADLIILAIKPQDAQEILGEFSKQNIFTKSTIFLSILVGKKIKFFENIFGNYAKIIRSMPNLPIQLEQGCFPYLTNKNILLKDKKLLSKIFKNFGYSFEIKNEDLFTPLTALYGSGPAYIFLLQELLYKMSIELGIDKKNSLELVKKLLLGSALMADKSNIKSNSYFKDLKDMVTSKKGTTAAALEVLEKKSNLEKLFKLAIKKAMQRAQKLAS